MKSHIKSGYLLLFLLLLLLYEYVVFPLRVISNEVKTIIYVPQKENGASYASPLINERFVEGKGWRTTVNDRTYT